jgi:hypothetical protein
MVFGNAEVLDHPYLHVLDHPTPVLRQTLVLEEENDPAAAFCQ